MDGVVHRSIHQVTKNKTREEQQYVGPHNEIHQPEQSRGYDQAWHGRHEESLPVARKMMMIAVQYINKFLSSFGSRFQVKNIPVGHVFKQTPKKHSSEEGQQYPVYAVIITGSAEVNHVTENWNIHSPDHQGVGLGQHFQKTILKKAGLAFIMNFFELHGAKIVKGKWGAVCRV